MNTIREVDAHWIGFSDQSREGGNTKIMEVTVKKWECLGYTWSDGSPVSFVNWNDVEPTTMVTMRIVGR